MKVLVLCLIFSLNAFAFKSTDAFIVELSDQKIKVTSPKSKVKIVSVIVKNLTFDKIRAELRSRDKVLKRFVIKAKKKEVFEVNYETAKKLFFVPVSPPFETIDLKFSKGPYEIPEKK